MKMQLHSIKDLDDLYGKFVIQLNEDNPIYINDLTEKEREFYYAKRIWLITYGLGPSEEEEHVVKVNLYGQSFPVLKSKYLEYFNTPNDGERFHRLLTSKELDCLFEWIKKRNY